MDTVLYEEDQQNLTLWKGSWCSLPDQQSSCSRSRALGCRGSCQNCVPARVPKSQLHPVGSQSDPAMEKRGTPEHENMLIMCNLVCLTMCEVTSKLLGQALRKNQAVLTHCHSQKKEKREERKCQVQRTQFLSCIFPKQFSNCPICPFILLLLLILLMEAWIHLPFHYPCRPNHTLC